MKLKHRLLATCVFGATALSGVAHAQEPALIEEIVVTAERRDQSLQDVPVAVSAFTDERREVVGINNVSDLTNFTPGLAYSTNNDRIAVRGIGRFTNNRSSEGGVAQYVDGFYSSSVTSANRSTIFTDRIEVLRGPQGTLYGRNSIGGAINIISKRPTDEFTGEVRATVGNYDLTILEGMVSGPITDNLRYRFTVNYQKQDEGYFENVSGGQDEGGIRDQYDAELQLEGSLGADDQLEWWFKASTSEWDNYGYGPGGRTGTIIGQYDTQNPFPSGVIVNPNFGFTGQYPGNTDLRSFSSDTPNHITNKVHTFTLQTVLHLENFDVKYLGGHTYYDYRLDTDLDNTARTGSYLLTRAMAPTSGAPVAGVQIFPSYSNNYAEEVWWFSNEVNIASTWDGPFQIQGGVYQYREGSNYFNTNARYVGQAQLATPIYTTGGIRPAPLNLDRSYAIAGSVNRSESYAAYTQGDYSFNDQWKLTAGLRYTFDRKQSEEGARLICFLAPSCAAAGTTAVDVSGSVYNPDAAAFGTSPTRPALDEGVVVAAYTDPSTGLRKRLLRKDWQAWTGTVGLDWTPDADTLVYGKYTRGYKAGGFNSGSLQQYPTTDAEFIDAFELGAKRTFFGRFQANASVYYYDYQGIQVPLSGIDPATGLTRTDFFNLEGATIKGFELETVWSPIQNLQILANYSYLDTEIQDSGYYNDAEDPAALQPEAQPRPGSTGASRPQSINGAALPSSTPHRVTVNVNYTFDFDAGSLTPSLSYVWRDDTYYSIFNRYYNKAKAFEQVDARAIFVDADDRFTVIGYVKNVFDVTGFSGVSGNRNPGNGFINQTVSLVQPRTYGVELQYRF